MCCISASDKQFWGLSDSQTIQNAVDYAEKTGRGRVVIPRHNERTGENIWIIEKTILLPSDMTVVLEDAHLRLADGVFENIFRNRNCRTDHGNTMEGEQKNIRILGNGNALLDGGKHNGLVEQMIRDNPGKYPPLSINLLIFLHNVRDFTISGLNIIDSRWWSICCVYCRWGRITDIDFKMYGTQENQDGIDLRVGCEYITIENITGITGDDTIAMTALPLDDFVPERKLKVEGKNPYIHDITIRNVISSTHGCSIIRFLCEDGAQLYNVLVDGIMDTGETYCGAPFFFGVSGTHFVKDRAHVMGEVRNITIRNVFTHAHSAIMLCESVQDMLIENVTCQGSANNIGIRFVKNFECKNLTIRNVSLQGDDMDSVCYSAADPQKLEGLTIENVRALKAKHLFRREKLPILNLVCDELTEEEFCPDDVKFPSAYSRYHLCSFGKVIENRPKENRFTGESK